MPPNPRTDTPPPAARPDDNADCSADDGPGVGAAPGSRQVPADRLLHSDALLRGARSVDILHAGVRYRLSVTALGKLILTK